MLNINNDIEDDIQNEYDYSSCNEKLLVSIDPSKSEEDNEKIKYQQEKQLRIKTGYVVNNKKCVYFTDILFSVFVASPLSGIYWYMSWTFLDEHFNVFESAFFTSFLSYFIGLSLILCSYLFQNHLEMLHDYLSKLKYFNKTSCFLLRSVYMYFICAAVVLEWQSLWNILFTKFIDWKTKLSISILAVSYLCLTRSSRILVSTPFLLLRDSSENFFQYELKSFNLIFLRLIKLIFLTRTGFMIASFVLIFSYPK
jgi:hypothetical protein